MKASLQALFIQIAAALLAAVLFVLAQSIKPGMMPLEAGLGMQAVLAASLSWRLGHPPWWWGIHLAFLPTLAFALALDVPPAWSLGAFLALLVTYWGVARTRVPLFLSGRRVWRALDPLLPAGRPYTFLDVGSGLGGLVLDLARRHSSGHFTGIEIAPAPWLISRLRAWYARSRVRFLRGDYAHLDLGVFDVVFAYLSPAAMPALWAQAQAQMRPGSVLVSLAFDVPGVSPDEVVEIAPGARHTLYVWRMPRTPASQAASSFRSASRIPDKGDAGGRPVRQGAGLPPSREV